MSIKQELEHKKIAIYGLGLEGQSSISYIQRNIQDYQLYLVDDFANDLSRFVGDRIQQADTSIFQQVDIILKSPGIALADDFPYFDKLTSQTDLFLKYYAKNCIGITGTKGKSTTTSLIYHLLSAVYHQVFLVGNIGKPVFDYLDQYSEESYYVYELSCHQLQHCHYSPKRAVFLNCYQEHLDRYKTFENYLKAKQNIYHHQQNTDYVYINQDLLNDGIPSKMIAIGKDVVWYQKEICYHNHKINLEHVNYHLLGEHNFYDIAVAYALCMDLGLSNEQFKTNLVTFKPLKHRLQFIGRFQEIDFYNDSISTSCESTMAAIDSIQNIDCILLGGLDRGIDYSKLLSYLPQTNLKHIIFMYQSGKRMMEEFKQRGQLDCYYCTDLKQAVEKAFDVCDKGCSVVLSPASASYDSFKNFEKRGDYFIELVENYKKVI